MMETRQIQADLLIIGGGSAGCMAAIRALELKPDLRVVIFEKGDIKYSGSIARGMDALNVVAIPNFTSPELYVEHVTSICEGVIDQAASYEMAKRSFALLKELESWGVYFPLDKSGNYHTLQMGPKAAFITAMEEPDLKVIISRMAIDKGAKVINRVMGVSLMTEGQRVTGAIGLNVRNGEMVVCQAKAVIITAGSQARFSLPNSGYLYGTFDYPGNSGDSYCMAYRAGARLTGMEYSLRHLLIKDANIPLLSIVITRGGRLLNVFDEVLMDGKLQSFKVMDDAHDAGLGPLRIRTKDMPLEMIQEIEHILFSTERPVQERFFKGREIDFRKQDIELWPTEHQICGGHGMSGIMINEKAETNLAGLYAAGDAACVPKQFLTGAFVFGQIAAESALAFMNAQPRAKADSTFIQQAEKIRNDRLNSKDGTITVKELEYKARRLISDYLISPKNEYKLKRWQEWSPRLRRELDEQVVVSNCHELAKLYEIDHIIQCADLSAGASLERKESRWGNCHFRNDYPEKDDQNWLCHVVVSQGETPQDLQTATAPVQATQF